MHDLGIRGGLVADGTGADRFRPRRERDLLELTAHTVDEFSNRGDQSLKHGYNPLLELHGHLIDQNQPAPVYALIHLQGLGRGTRI